MKKIVFVLSTLALASCLVTSAFGQAAGLTGGTATQNETQVKVKGARHNIVEMLNKLNLTDDQKAKIKELVTKNQETLKAIRKQVKAGTLTKEDAKKQIQANRKENMGKVRLLLTKDQKKQLAQLMRDARQKEKGQQKTDPKTGGGN